MTDGSTVLLVLRMLLSLVVVLGLVVLFARIVERRRGARPARSRRRAPRVGAEVLSRTHLARGTSLQIVRVGAQVLLLGVTDSSVRVLTELSAADLEEEDVDDSTDADHHGPPAGRSPRDQGRAARAVFEQFMQRQQGGRHRAADRDDAQG